MDTTYTVSEVADKLKLSDKTLRRWEEAGRFRSSRTLGNQRRYSTEDLQILDAIKHGTITSQSDLLTKAQAATLCGVTEVTIDRWEREGKIHPFITVGKTYYPRHKLIAKMRELKEKYVPEPEPVESTTKSISEPDIPGVKGAHTPGMLSLTETPKLTPLPLTHHTPSFDIRSSLFNILIMVLLLTGYHLLVTAGSTKPTSPQGAVQGVATAADPSLTLLKTILDPAGALTTTTITARTLLSTPTISFSPTSAPSTPTPGMLYYDASAQTLKVFKGKAWVDLALTKTLQVEDAGLITGMSAIAKGKNQSSVSNPDISPDTPVTITFATDYAPAKKYWLETDDGSLTVHTDFPVGADAPFNYFIIVPLSEEIDSTATLSARPTSPLDI